MDRGRGPTVPPGPARRGATEARRPHTDADDARWRRTAGVAIEVDLYSDTVTRPTPAMRRAMAEAEVGDEQHHEDPTVNRLQERVAELLGKEAAVFLPSGTMANEISIRVHT